MGPFLAESQSNRQVQTSVHRSTRLSVWTCDSGQDRGGRAARDSCPQSCATHGAEPQPSLRWWTGNAASAPRSTTPRSYQPPRWPSPEPPSLQEPTAVRGGVSDSVHRRRRGLTFLVPLHVDPVSLEEALVGQRSGGSSQHRVLVQADKRRCPFTPRDVDGHLRGAAEAGSEPRHLPESAPGGLGPLHLAGLSSRRQREVRNLLHVKFVGNRVWKNTASRRTNNMIRTKMMTAASL